MPTPIKSVENMTKHLTRSERDARKSAERSLERNTRVQLRAPAWLRNEALKIWNDTKRRLKGIDLLDSVDIETFAIWCDACAHYQAASKRLADENPTKDDIAAAQGWARLVFNTGEKLGLTLSGRTRLAKKKADPEPPDEFEQLLNDVWESVNDRD